MITAKTTVLAVLIAAFIVLVAIDGRRKINRKREQAEKEKSVH